ncbi:hypothetical protein DFO67_11539 [Modicisalibacter xianhensis]|uniref:Uncharacterized protein n=1 Tax=Modicisalibacter xianhensis TaxID=442341 RepID=A0A4R8FKR0_9GAMM|nr:hypothetical protein DFO67_11539 [Halomonas xianhensis]
MYQRTIPHSMLDASLCPPPSPDVIRIAFRKDGSAWCYELPKRPFCGLSSIRFTEILDDFSYALQARKGNSTNALYLEPGERTAHAMWLDAHAEALERDAKLARTLARRLAG